MKKFFMLAAVAIMAMSCSDDDNSSTNNNQTSLVGTWKLTALTTDEPLDINGDDVESTDFIAETECFDETQLVFNSNSTAVMTLNYYFFGCYEASAPADWSLSGNTVTFTYDMGDGEEEMTGTVSGNTLSIYDERWYEVEVEVDGQVQTTSIPATLVFTKQ